jgi:hypothetical protein
MARISPTPYTLVSNGAVSPWLDLTGIDGSFPFTIAITGTLTCALEIANDVDNKTDAVIAESYISSDARTVNKPFPRLMRFRNTSGTGTAIIALGRAVGTNGNFADIPQLGTSNTPTQSF